MQTVNVTRRALLASGATLPLATIAAKPFSGPVYKDSSATVDARVRDLLGKMTLEEKAAQMRCLWFQKVRILDADCNFSAEKASKVINEGIGQVARPSDQVGTKLYPGDTMRGIADSVTLINAIQRFLVEQTRLGIPALFHEETAHGLAVRDATIFPIPPALGSTWDPALVERVFSVAGREARLHGATVGLSPVIDLAREPRWGRVEEHFGEDPYLVSQMGIASVRGQQGTRPLGPDKVFVTLKHFIHGSPQAGINVAPADMSERTLRELYLVPFERIIKATDPAIIMPSYNEVEGVPAHANVDLLIKTGRQRLGFKGAYFSDYNGVTNLKKEHHMAADDAECAVLAINAGVDAELPDGLAFAKLPELVRAGRLAEAQIDAAVGRILALKFEAGLFEHPYVDAKRAVRGTNMPVDIKLARAVAQKAVVLLKNDGVLPLDSRAKLKLALIGPNAEPALFGGYSGINASGVGILSGIKAAAGPGIAIEYAEGCRIVEPSPSGSSTVKFGDAQNNKALIAEAVEVAARSDLVILVVGDRPEVTREAVAENRPGDRDSLDLFGDQNALVDAVLGAGKPVIAVLINGRALSVNTLAEKANALVEGWYLGQEGGHALADVLFGRVNPGGKLTVTFPRTVGDLPLSYNRHPSTDLNKYVEGKRSPLFPFGHGLSYTKFELSVPRLENASIAASGTATVLVDVKNVGNRRGDEVVQLYIRDDVSSVPRPILELRGFERVTLDAGETRTVRFQLDPDALAFWDRDMAWRVEPGSFTISTGPSSANLQSTKLTVT